MHTLDALVRTYLSVLDLAVSAGRTARATRDGYDYQFRHLAGVRDADGTLLLDREAAGLIPEDLAGTPYTHHFTAAVRRLFKWAHESGRIPEFRFKAFKGRVKGQRQRTLSHAEYRRVRRAAAPALRHIVWFLRNTMARPGEARALRWHQVDLDAHLVRLGTFKAKDRRRDGVVVRKIPLTPLVVRMLARWCRERNPLPTDPVLTNSRGRPWTCAALRLAMYRAANRAGLNGGTGERVVCYTLRHTGATEATRRGVRDRLLADILGHTTTRTTARYQHLADEDLVRGIEQATRRPRTEQRRRA